MTIRPTRQTRQSRIIIIMIAAFLVIFSQVSVSHALSPQQYCQALQVRTPAAPANTKNLQSEFGVASSAIDSNEVLNLVSAMIPNGAYTFDTKTIKYCNAGSFCILSLIKSSGSPNYGVENRFCN